MRGFKNTDISGFVFPYHSPANILFSLAVLQNYNRCGLELCVDQYSAMLYNK